ncbi:histidine phosphatase family protein [Tumebacillus permanentifrigoris]|uniref:Putative phosphoglycerate mutase n=1 Tax=Tumebacillus permanentifrigoris TaxID=378543 RepID=A0A316D3R0_9BACL|nr:histidine phosphatase family protein [Tumebacillus permanentifrigoris]PWK06304.1 putative phosphoglycerate mutase [Tumebacillus permanentifrigoris]
MTGKTFVTLVRHGETIWNRELRLQGSQDIPLSEVGLAQAEAVAKRLQHEPCDVVYSSHLSRAHRTAEMVAGSIGVEHQVCRDLMERSYGELEGWTREQILAKFPDFWGPGKEFSVAGLETFEELAERAKSAILEIVAKHAGGNVLIVSHGGTINAFLHSISDGVYGSGVNKLGNTSVSRVVFQEDGAWSVEMVGCTTHLLEE